MKKNIAIFIAILLIVTVSNAQQKKNLGITITNPIIAGFYPDPSICRVGNDYYIVNSSFEFYPGLPIFHSKDLAHWEQIGYAMNRPSQLDLDSTDISGGLYAPTIRYINSTYYIVNTLARKRKGQRGNFIISANHPAGPWSDPIWLKDANGIDPSLFQDTDGKVYFSANGRNPDSSAESKLRHIWTQEIDLKNYKFIGEKKIILVEGALHGASNAESPHIYKKNGWYYLIIAEGGTAMNHAVTVFRSKTILGNYESNKKNPILTHRFLGKDYPISTIGHADMVETQNGEWWMVVLGVRPYATKYHNIGRETFMVPVKWEEEWPVVNSGYGIVLSQQPGPKLPIFTVKQPEIIDDFNADSLALVWNFIRTPRKIFWSLIEKKGTLRIHVLPEKITELGSPAFIGQRQTDTSCEASCEFKFTPKTEYEKAGMILYQNSNQQYRVEKVLKNNRVFLELIKRELGNDEVLYSEACTDETITLGASFSNGKYDFKLKQKDGKWKTIFARAKGEVLSTIGITFTGTFIGMYASSNGVKSTNFMDVSWFSYSKK